MLSKWEIVVAVVRVLVLPVLGSHKVEIHPLFAPDSPPTPKNRKNLHLGVEACSKTIGMELGTVVAAFVQSRVIINRYSTVLYRWKNHRSSQLIFTKLRGLKPGSTL